MVIGLAMALVFRRSESERARTSVEMPEPPPSRRPLWQTALFFLAMILFLVFSDWYNTGDVTITMDDGAAVRANIRYSTRDALDIQVYEPDGHLGSEVRRIGREAVARIEPEPGFVTAVHGVKWYLAGAMGLAVLAMAWRWFSKAEVRQWLEATWDFGLLIVPLLFIGVFVTGFVGGLIPEQAVARLVGGNSLPANFVASFVGMIWYFATLTEIPIVEMLTRLGMGRGPALALLLAGPALSLPSILVIYKVVGLKKTLAFCVLAVVMSTLVGWLFGMLAA
jgi:uncharacterized membrane protein YraQ (UPF0718 family)